MNVLITGAAGGLGRVFINECLKRNYDVCATDIDESGLKQIKDGMFFKHARSILTFPCDITNKSSLDRLMDYLMDNGFEVDMLLNVAGMDKEGGFLERNFSEIEKIIHLNVLGTLGVTHKVLSYKEISKPFYIINISSLAANQPIPLKATYAASKRFLLDFSRALSQELSSKKVKVLAVCPGGLATRDDVMKAIEGQGFFGAITTCNMEKVVSKSIDYVIKGKQIYVPGGVNKFSRFISYFIPVGTTTKILYKRWLKAQSTWLHKKEG